MDKFEKSIKEKLLAYESEVNPVVWDNVSLAIGMRRRKRRLLIYMVAALIILALLLLSFYISNNKAQEEEDKPDTIIAFSPEVQGKINYFSSDLENGADIEPENDEILVSENRSIGGSADLASSKTAVYKTLLSGKPALNSIIYETRSEITHNRNNAGPAINKLPGESNFFLTPDYYPGDHEMKNSISHKIAENIINSGKGSGYKSDPDDCFRSEKDKWFIEVNAAPLFGMKSLSGSNTTLIDLRRNSENPWVSYSFGAKIGYDLKGTIVRAGIDYTSHNEKFRHIVKNVVSTQTVITIDTIRHTDGTYSITRDTTVKEIFTEDQIKKTNSYRMIGIPLIVGYEFRNNKHSFGLNAGFIINILLNNSGFILDENGNVEDLSVIGNRIFLKNSGVSLYSSFLYSYSPDGRYTLFAEPRFVYNISPMTRIDYPLSQKLYNFGISFGARYLF